MTDFEKIWDFENLYKAHKSARRGKQKTKEVISFELDLSRNLTELSGSIRNGTYSISGYYTFQVSDPKQRTIHALHYPDRVVQHCLCDEVLGPLLDRRLIYDNAACRIGKGTHFALDRVDSFLREFYKRFGTQGWFLKCDIRKFFDCIDHGVLKRRLERAVRDTDVLALLYRIIDSYETAPGKGLPLGNQTSQWFAIYYLDGFDRLIKEKMRIRYYSRYMDDCVLICEDKEYLKACRLQLEDYLHNELRLQFDSKTQIFPIRCGVDYLGWHIYMTETGKVIRKLRSQAKTRLKRRLRYLQEAYRCGEADLEDIVQVLNSYRAHLAHGHTYKLLDKTMRGFVLTKE